MFNHCNKNISAIDCVVHSNLQSRKSIEFLQRKLVTLDYLMIPHYTSLIDIDNCFFCCFLSLKRPVPPSVFSLPV